MFDELIGGSTADSPYLEVQASAKSAAGRALAKLNRKAEARAYFEAALKTHRVLLQESRNSTEQQLNSTVGMIAACEGYRMMGDLTTALSICRSAVELAESIEKRGPREPAVLYLVGNAYLEYARTLPAAEARQWFEKDAALWRGGPDSNQYVELRKRQAAANLARF